ncbi:TlyA family rRNA (cytidine-2'-O)-methyltransferase [Lujinxingia litoralis]|uniref:TlyA family rRNA (Cytidine-2'-O)-methyltransferase n=1 Tax=Lujinxingia litoralis TaxID=2211119 RepID=A0A328C6S0_9DELT|nr:TlyA family RNA methyltransferase [Lujinxingia litoralis]RAL20694.1 TlyA family rRNA (cytidine-2'-O)-methyltransferase [Lujinxingia litoralis]
MAQKERIDRLLVDRELVDTRTRAQARIMAGDVFVNGQRVDKAGTRVPTDAAIELKGQNLPFVSRGGLKLQAALDAFDYDCTDKVVIDVGASTGGFTDCVLQRHARNVYAVDVGYGQLAWKIRQDPRVINLERQNIRHLDPALIPEPCDLAVIDCSFISLDLVLPATLRFLKPEADLIALIKPQFEVGPDNVGKGGVVRDLDARQGAIERVIDQARAHGMHHLKGIDCPVHGPAGNIEYLAWFQRRA